MKRFASFALVGGLGFIADAAVLALLLAVTTLHPLAARIVSIGFALSLTWLLNRFMTFGPSSRKVAVEGARYGGVGIGTGIANYLCYAALVAAGLHPLLALAGASAAAMGLSWIGYSRLVFDR